MLQFFVNMGNVYTKALFLWVQCWIPETANILVGDLWDTMSVLGSLLNRIRRPADIRPLRKPQDCIAALFRKMYWRANGLNTILFTGLQRPY